MEDRHMYRAYYQQDETRYILSKDFELGERIPKLSKYFLISIVQCTGLKDKNGKLIYEDDILEDTQGNRGFVEYYPCSFNWRWGEGCDYYPIENFCVYAEDNCKCSLEYVGNISEPLALSEKI